MKLRRRLEVWRRMAMIRVARALPWRMRKRVVARQVYGFLKNALPYTPFDRHEMGLYPDE